MKNQNKTITIGEGNTPLLRLENLENILNLKGQLWAKAEYQNPTGSFKDRGSVSEINEAIRQKKKGVVCASTGNMAASLAAFAAKYQLSCLVIVPKGTPKAKLQQALICGAKLIKVDGNYDSCVDKAKQLAKKNNFFLCGDYELRRKGQSTIGEELAKSGVNFDAFIVPVGNGTVGCAVSQGFAKYNKFPAFVGVQGKGADPLARTFQKQSLTFISLEKPQTIASAMNVGNPLDGKLTLDWAYKTNGLVLSVTDGEILAAQKLLATTEGLYVEPAAAATVAALFKLPSRNQATVLILTGNGLKGGDKNERKQKRND